MRIEKIMNLETKVYCLDALLNSLKQTECVRRILNEDRDIEMGNTP